VTPACDPRGRFRAWASMDRTVRIWALTTRASVALVGHTGAVNAVAYLPDGRRLVSAGGDGRVILWDADRRVLLAAARPDPGPTPTQNAINALVVSPDGGWGVIRREGGSIVRRGAGNLGGGVGLPRGWATQGPVEALAISHDGKSLAASVVSFGIARLGDRPRVECDVELRDMPTGVVRARVARTSNLAHACAFSP